MDIKKATLHSLADALKNKEITAELEDFLDLFYQCNFSGGEE